MQTWMKVVLAGVVPAMFFLVLHDTVQGFYGPSRELPLSYVVVEEEPVEEVAADPVEEPAPAEEDVAEAPAEEAPAEEEMAEAPAEEAPAEEDVAEAPAEDAPAAEEVVEAPAEDAAETETMMAGLSPDEMQAGEAAARACASCHQLARERNAVGPHLVDVGGRAVGSVEGFRYSDALMALNEQGAVWTAEELEIWLEDPSAYAPGTKMMYAVRDAEERRLIAGWLSQREQ